MLHNHHIEGKELDIAYHNFKQTYCDKCPDCKERPAGWIFEGKPTKREAEFLTTLIGTAYDMRRTEED
jgi:7-cyano-7-deazaguanine synthase in queuosine biosynthesis